MQERNNSPAIILTTMMPVSYLFTDESKSRRNIILVVETIDLTRLDSTNLTLYGFFVLCGFTMEMSGLIIYCSFLEIIVLFFVERRGEECHAYYNIKRVTVSISLRCY